MSRIRGGEACRWRGVGAGGRLGAVVTLGVFRSRISNLPRPAQPVAKPSADILGRTLGTAGSGLLPRGRASYHNNRRMQLLAVLAGSKFFRRPRRPPCHGRRCVRAVRACRECMLSNGEPQSSVGDLYRYIAGVASRISRQKMASLRLIAMPVVLPHHSRAFLHEYC